MVYIYIELVDGLINNQQTSLGGNTLKRYPMGAE